MKMIMKNQTNDLDYFVQTPHWFFKDFLPVANHTQLKIVGEIIRQTLGWHKKYDNSTLGVLAKKIGSSRDAVSRNIQSLIDAGIIALANEEYGYLDTPEKRRQSGVAKKTTAFAINPNLVLTQDKIDILRKPVSRHKNVVEYAKSSHTGKTSNCLTVRHNKTNIPKERKETVVAAVKTPRKFHKAFKKTSCQKCGRPVDPMERVRAGMQRRQVLCMPCKGGDSNVK
jgi:RNase P subunit RPR2